jgi:hypothetical protein
MLYNILVGIPEEKELGRLRSRWESNMRKDLGELGCGDVDWMRLVQDRN